MHSQNNSRMPAAQQQNMRGRSAAHHNVSRQLLIRLRRIVIDNRPGDQLSNPISSDYVYTDMPWPNIQPPAVDPLLPSSSGMDQVSIQTTENTFPASSTQLQVDNSHISNLVSFPSSIEEESMAEVPFPRTRSEPELLIDENILYRDEIRARQRLGLIRTTNTNNWESNMEPISHPSSSSSPFFFTETRSQQCANMNASPLSSQMNMELCNSGNPFYYPNRFVQQTGATQNNYPEVNEWYSRGHSSNFGNTYHLERNEPSVPVQQTLKFRQRLKVGESCENIYDPGGPYNDDQSYSVNQQFVQNTYHPSFEVHKQPDQNFFTGSQSNNNDCSNLQYPFTQSVQQQQASHSQQLYNQETIKQELLYCSSLNQQVLGYDSKEGDIERPGTSGWCIRNPTLSEENNFPAQYSSYCNVPVSCHSATIDDNENHTTYEMAEYREQMIQEHLVRYQYEEVERIQKREKTVSEQHTSEILTNKCYIETCFAPSVRPGTSQIQITSENKSYIKKQLKVLVRQAKISHGSQGELHNDKIINETNELISDLDEPNRYITHNLQPRILFPLLNDSSEIGNIEPDSLATGFIGEFNEPDNPVVSIVPEASAVVKTNSSFLPQLVFQQNINPSPTESISEENLKQTYKTDNSHSQKFLVSHLKPDTHPVSDIVDIDSITFSLLSPHQKHLSPTNQVVGSEDSDFSQTQNNPLENIEPVIPSTSAVAEENPSMISNIKPQQTSFQFQTESCLLKAVINDLKAQKSIRETRKLAVDEISYLADLNIQTRQLLQTKTNSQNLSSPVQLQEPTISIVSAAAEVDSTVEPQSLSQNEIFSSLSEAMDVENTFDESVDQKSPNPLNEQDIFRFSTLEDVNPLTIPPLKSQQKQDFSLYQILASESSNFSQTQNDSLVNPEPVISSVTALSEENSDTTHDIKLQQTSIQIQTEYSPIEAMLNDLPGRPLYEQKIEFSVDIEGNREVAVHNCSLNIPAPIQVANSTISMFSAVVESEPSVVPTTRPQQKLFSSQPNLMDVENTFDDSLDQISPHVLNEQGISDVFTLGDLNYQKQYISPLYEFPVSEISNFSQTNKNPLRNPGPVISSAFALAEENPATTSNIEPQQTTFKIQTVSNPMEAMLNDLPAQKSLEETREQCLIEVSDLPDLKFQTGRALHQQKIDFSIDIEENREVAIHNSSQNIPSPIHVSDSTTSMPSAVVELNSSVVPQSQQQQLFSSLPQFMEVENILDDTVDRKSPKFLTKQVIPDNITLGDVNPLTTPPFKPPKKQISPSHQILESERSNFSQTQNDPLVINKSSILADAILTSISGVSAIGDLNPLTIPPLNSQQKQDSSFSQIMTSESSNFSQTKKNSLENTDPVISSGSDLVEENPALTPNIETQKPFIQIQTESSPIETALNDLPTQKSLEEERDQDDIRILDLADLNAQTEHPLHQQKIDVLVNIDENRELKILNSSLNIPSPIQVVDSTIPMPSAVVKIDSTDVPQLRPQQEIFSSLPESMDVENTFDDSVVHKPPNALKEQDISDVSTLGDINPLTIPPLNSQQKQDSPFSQIMTSESSNFSQTKKNTLENTDPVISSGSDLVEENPALTTNIEPQKPFIQIQTESSPIEAALNDLPAQKSLEEEREQDDIRILDLADLNAQTEHPLHQQKIDVLVNIDENRELKILNSSLNIPSPIQVVDSTIPMPSAVVKIDSTDVPQLRPQQEIFSSLPESMDVENTFDDSVVHKPPNALKEQDISDVSTLGDINPLTIPPLNSQQKQDSPFSQIMTSESSNFSQTKKNTLENTDPVISSGSDLVEENPALTPNIEPQKPFIQIQTESSPIEAALNDLPTQKFLEEEREQDDIRILDLADLNAQTEHPLHQQKIDVLVNIDENRELKILNSSLNIPSPIQVVDSTIPMPSAVVKIDSTDVPQSRPQQEIFSSLPESMDVENTFDDSFVHKPPNALKEQDISDVSTLGDINPLTIPPLKSQKKQNSSLYHFPASESSNVSQTQKDSLVITKPATSSASALAEENPTMTTNLEFEQRSIHLQTESSTLDAVTNNLTVQKSSGVSWDANCPQFAIETSELTKFNIQTGRSLYQQKNDFLTDFEENREVTIDNCSQNIPSHIQVADSTFSMPSAVVEVDSSLGQQSRPQQHLISSLPKLLDAENISDDSVDHKSTNSLTKQVIPDISTLGDVNLLTPPIKPSKKQLSPPHQILESESSNFSQTQNDPLVTTQHAILLASDLVEENSSMTTNLEPQQTSIQIQTKSSPLEAVTNDHPAQKSSGITYEVEVSNLENLIISSPIQHSVPAVVEVGSSSVLQSLPQPKLIPSPTDSLSVAGLNNSLVEKSSEGPTELLEDLPIPEPIHNEAAPPVCEMKASSDKMFCEELLGSNLPESLPPEMNPLSESVPPLPIEQGMLPPKPVQESKSKPLIEEAVDADDETVPTPPKILKKPKETIKLKTKGIRISTRKRKIPERLFYIGKGVQF